MLKSFLLFFAVVLLAVACLPLQGRSPQQTAPAPAPAPAPALGSARQPSRPRRPRPIKNPVKPTAESQAKAKSLYQMDCAMCHGDNGNGKTDLATSMGLTIDDWTDPKTLGSKEDWELFNVIRNGKGDKMPPESSGRATDTEVWNLVIYMRSFAKSQPRISRCSRAVGARESREPASRYDGFLMPTTSDFHSRWALITGASSGIGAALARELAARGAKLILTARRRDRLQPSPPNSPPWEPRRASWSPTSTIPPRLNKSSPSLRAAGLAVDILVNNAGLGLYGAFITNDAAQEFSQVRVNCEAVVHLSRLFIPRMVERRRGWMLVVASSASFQPVPYLSTYAATKAFDRFFALGSPLKLRASA